MVDFIKMQLLDNSRFEKYMISNKVIELLTFIDNFSGEIKEYPKIGKLLNLAVKINPVYSNISGSLHKFENIKFRGEEQNYNDFTYSQLSKLVPEIISFFDIENNTSLGYLEFGFNLRLDYDPQKFIDNQLLMYNYKSSSKDLKFNGNGDYKEFIKTDYCIKIYNKSKPFKLEENLLRIELKITKKRFLQKYNIYRLEDLLDKEKLFVVFEILCTEFENLIIIDNFNNLNIPVHDIEKLNKYTNPNYWQRLKTDGKSYKVQDRLKKDFQLILAKYELNKTKNTLRDKLISKFWDLIDEDFESLFLSKEIA